MFPLSHLANLFPYLLLAAFYVMLVVNSYDAADNQAERDSANEVISSKFAKKTLAGNDATQAEFSDEYSNHNYQPALSPPSSPLITIQPETFRGALYKIYLLSGPSRAPPFCACIIL